MKVLCNLGKAKANQSQLVICMYIYIYMCVCVYIYICVCVCVFVCMYIYIYIYTFYIYIYIDMYSPRLQCENLTKSHQKSSTDLINSICASFSHVGCRDGSRSRRCFGGSSQVIYCLVVLVLHVVFGSQIWPNKNIQLQIRCDFSWRLLSTQLCFRHSDLPSRLTPARNAPGSVQRLWTVRSEKCWHRRVGASFLQQKWGVML